MRPAQVARKTHSAKHAKKCQCSQSVCWQTGTHEPPGGRRSASCSPPPQSYTHTAGQRTDWVEEVDALTLSPLSSLHLPSTHSTLLSITGLHRPSICPPSVLPRCRMQRCSLHQRPLQRGHRPCMLPAAAPPPSAAATARPQCRAAPAPPAQAVARDDDHAAGSGMSRRDLLKGIVFAGEHTPLGRAADQAAGRNSPTPHQGRQHRVPSCSPSLCLTADVCDLRRSGQTSCLVHWLFGCRRHVCRRRRVAAGGHGGAIGTSRRCQQQQHVKRRVWLPGGCIHSRREPTASLRHGKRRPRPDEHHPHRQRAEHEQQRRRQQHKRQRQR